MTARRWWPFAAVGVLALGLLLLLARPGGAAPEVHRATTERHVVRLVVPQERAEPWRVEVDHHDGRPAAVPEVALDPVMPGMGHALEPVPAHVDGPGRYRADITLPMRGPWQITVRLHDGANDEQVAFAVLP